VNESRTARAACHLAPFPRREPSFPPRPPASLAPPPFLFSPKFWLNMARPVSSTASAPRTTPSNSTTGESRANPRPASILTVTTPPSEVARVAASLTTLVTWEREGGGGLEGKRAWARFSHSTRADATSRHAQDVGECREPGGPRRTERGAARDARKKNARAVSPPLLSLTRPTSSTLRPTRPGSMAALTRGVAAETSIERGGEF
jgi:hypothetical protein